MTTRLTIKTKPVTPTIRLDAKPSKPHSTKHGARGYRRQAMKTALRKILSTQES